MGTGAIVTILISHARNPRTLVLRLGDDFDFDGGGLGGGVELICGGTLMLEEEALWGEAIEGAVCVTDAWVDVGAAANFKVEVGGVGSEGGADGADLISALDGLARGDEALIQVRINGLDDFVRATVRLRDAVGDDDHVPPAFARDAVINDAACTCGIDGIAQIGVHATDAIQVIAQVAGDAEGLRIVRQRSTL